MTFSELKDKNRSLAKSILHWMSVAAQALARVDVLEDLLKRKDKYIEDLCEAYRRRGDELQRLRGNEQSLLSAIGDTARERGIKEDLSEQIDKLAKFILAEIPGEPSSSEGAVDTAIRLLRHHVVRRAQRVALMSSDPRWRPSSVRKAMDEINELIKTLPEKTFLRDEPLQLVILRALKRMHRSMELHTSFDTTIGRMLEAEQRFEELRTRYQEAVVEPLNDALVGHAEFNDVEVGVEDRAIACINRLGAENRKLREELGEYQTGYTKLSKEKNKLFEASLTLRHTIDTLEATKNALAQKVLDQAQGRKASNKILAEAMNQLTVDGTENPVFYANRAAQYIINVSDDNRMLRIENNALKSVKGFPHNGTCVLDANWSCFPPQQVHLAFTEGRLTQLSVKPISSQS